MEQNQRVILNYDGMTGTVIARVLHDNMPYTCFRKSVVLDLDPTLRDALELIPETPEGCVALPERTLDAWLNSVKPDILPEFTEVSTSFNGYQQQARKYAVYPEEHKLTYPTLGLTGEAGEVAEKVKKCIRDNGGVVSDEKRDEIVKELGDVLWYIAALADSLGVDLQEVATTNINKLESRCLRSQLHGSGDNR